MQSTADIAPVRTITMETLQTAELQKFPTLRLRLKYPHPPDGHGESQGYIYRATQYFKDMFTKEAADFKLEESATSEAMSKNQKKIHKIFKKIKSQVDELEKQAMEELPTLSPEQQEDLLTFWSEVANFFSDLIGWLKSIFQEVIEKIREGFRLDEETVTIIFQKAVEFFKSISSNVELQTLGRGQSAKKAKGRSKEGKEEEGKEGQIREEQRRRESREEEGKEEEGNEGKRKEGKEGKGQSLDEQVHK